MPGSSTSLLSRTALLASAVLMIACSAPAAAPKTETGGAPTSAPAPKPTEAPKPAAPAAPAAAPAAPAAASPAAAPTAAAAVPAKPLGKVTFALPSPSLSFSPFVVADKKGFFKEVGIEPEIVYAGSGSKAAAAVIGGSAQVGGSDLGDMVGAVEKGQDVKVFGSLVARPTTTIVLRKSVAEKLGLTEQTPVEQRIKALKGLKMAISTPGSGTDVMLRYLLAANGLDPERDVQILTTGSVVNSLAAYAQGAADGASLSSPSSETALLQNDAMALVQVAKGDVPALRNETQSGLWATGKWLDSNPELATAVLIAIWKAQDYMKGSPGPAGELVFQESWKDTDPKVFDLAWKNALQTFPETPAVSPEGLSSLIQYIGVTEKREVKLTVDTLATNSVFLRAKAQLGR